MLKKIISYFFLSALFISCGLTDDITKKDSPTTGKVNFYFDEGLTLHIQNQMSTFKTTYTYADINLVSTDEKTCIEALFNDSAKVIGISRMLSAEENKKFKQKNISVNTSLVAQDAIAIIVHKNFSDSTISIQQLKQLLKGNDSNYVKGKHINVVFDNQNSGSTRHLKDSLLPKINFGKNCSALKNTPELITSISQNSLSIGICDFAWLSDRDDVTTKAFLKNVKILAVSKKDFEKAYMPDQSNIATHDYPLLRTICIIRRSSEFTLGKGIETFIAGPVGQLMFLKQGLPPNRQEERLIEIDMTPLK
jgi:phosphate transport system substrate-binding protein